MSNIEELERLIESLANHPLVNGPSGITDLEEWLTTNENLQNIANSAPPPPEDPSNPQFQNFIISTHPTQPMQDTVSTVLATIPLGGFITTTFQLSSLITTLDSQGYRVDNIYNENSFFRVITGQLNSFSLETTPETLRQDTIEYIRTHHGDFLPAIGLDTYASSPSQHYTITSEFADYPIIAATSRVTEANINIHYANGYIASISHENYNRTIEIGYAEEHYVSLIPQEPADEPLPGHGCWYFNSSS